jgi:hypothetical protein
MKRQDGSGDYGTALVDQQLLFRSIMSSAALNEHEPAAVAFVPCRAVCVRHAKSERESQYNVLRANERCGTRVLASQSLPVDKSQGWSIVALARTAYYLQL